MFFKKRLAILISILSLTTLFFSCGSSSSDSSEKTKRTIHQVNPAMSPSNVFANIDIPQNPGLADNNWNGGHQDSYCSESVGLYGPNTETLKLVQRENPYGFTPIMACNSKNQMIAVALDKEDSIFRVIVFDENLKILTATPFSKKTKGSFVGGYFMLDKDDNSILVGDNKIIALPTSNVKEQNNIYELESLWVSKDIVKLVTGDSSNNSLYATMPFWDNTRPNTFWCLLSGAVTSDDKVIANITGNVFMAIVEIVPDPNEPGKCKTILIDKLELEKQWNNNTFAVDEKGAYFVTNSLNDQGVFDSGYLYSVGFDENTQKITTNWKYEYENSGILKVGMKNIGSGTTPTLMIDDSGRKFLAIGDNASPRMNVELINYDDGKKVGSIPVFTPYRSADEASFIGVNNYVVAENNFGHTTNPPYSQLEPNEPGLAMIEFDTRGIIEPEILWENKTDSIFGMSMLARESGVIFAFTGSWEDPIASTEGGMYSVTAFDAMNGNTFWKIPLGRGFDYTHEVGGIYFNRNGDLFVGSNLHLFSIQAHHE